MFRSWLDRTPLWLLELMRLVYAALAVVIALALALEAARVLLGGGSVGLALEEALCLVGTAFMASAMAYELDRQKGRR